MSRKRKRLSWDFNDRTADPYGMNQDRENQFPASKYMIGDPSAFAEDVHDDMPDDPALGRNEVGLPNMSEWNMNHKDVDSWNSDAPYDNADTFSPEDRDRQASSRRKEAAERKRRMFAAAQKKARRCIKIAENLFPEAPEQVLEDQAVDFMSLSDRVVEATLERLRKSDEYKKEAEANAMLREMLSEEKEDEEEEEEDDEDKKESSADEMLREMLSEEDDKDDKDDKKKKEEKEEKEDEEDEDDKKESAEDEKEDEDDDDKESSLSEMAEMDEDEEDVEAMIDKMMMEDEEAGMQGGEVEDAGMHQDHDAAELGIELDPTLETVDAGGIDEDDRVLNQLFNDTIPKEAREQQTEAQTSKQARQGVPTLGGRVKAASDQDANQGDDLSSIWEEDPDISGAF